MNALELATVLEKDPNSMVDIDAAEMLRKQDEAIKTLREALGGVMHLNNGEPEFVTAFKALAATEQI